MEEINKVLTEAMGDCWHDWDGKASWSLKDMCRCGAHPACHLQSPNFSTWEGFGKLWEWAIDQKWWPEFEAHQGLPKHWVPKKLIKPEFFAEAVADFLQKK